MDATARPGAADEPVVFVVSDSLGETAERVTRAAASQFDGGGVTIRRFPYTDDERAVVQLVAQARECGAAVVYTLIRPELRRVMMREATRHAVPAVDVMGPVMDVLTSVARGAPRLEPGLIHRLDEEYFHRVEAVEFTVKCDDGRDPRSLPRADIVLIGVSRSSKTPVSMYLAHRRYKVANVPLVPEVEPPEELRQVPVRRIVGLRIQAEKLREIRRERLRAIGLAPDSSYGDLGRIQEELAFAQRTFERIGCPVVDVSNKAVEETANRVLEIVYGRDRRE
jgi:regulator of PEP synthase PpsR (kinase-PPPase family)